MKFESIIKTLYVKYLSIILVYNYITNKVTFKVRLLKIDVSNFN